MREHPSKACACVEISSGRPAIPLNEPGSRGAGICQNFAFPAALGSCSALHVACGPRRGTQHAADKAHGAGRRAGHHRRGCALHAHASPRLAYAAAMFSDLPPHRSRLHRRPALNAKNHIYPLFTKGQAPIIHNLNPWPFRTTASHVIQAQSCTTCCRSAARGRRRCARWRTASCGRSRCTTWATCSSCARSCGMTCAAMYFCNSISLLHIEGSCVNLCQLAWCAMLGPLHTLCLKVKQLVPPQLLDAYLKRLEGMKESHGGKLTDDWCGTPLLGIHRALAKTPLSRDGCQRRCSL